MLTLFAVPKPFTGAAERAQRNALDSWKRAVPDAQVILFGDEAGIEEAAREAGVEHVGTIARNEFGTPLLDDVFAKAQMRSRHRLCCYLNADIILLDGLPAVLEKLRMPRFLGVGRRTDLDVPDRIDFGPTDWARRLRDRARVSGHLHDAVAMDYFLFPTGTLTGMPPFPVGRVLWDNWMVHHARSNDTPVFDLTNAVTIVHQNHDYGHVAGGQKAVWTGIEAQRNWQVLGPDFFPLTIDDATWTLDKGPQSEPRQLCDVRHLVRRLLVYPALSPRLKPSVRVARWMRQRIVGQKG